jgi:hypothetical protein
MKRRRGADWTPLAALVWLCVAPSASEAQSSSQDRTFNLINRCGETIWIGITGASTGDLPGGLTLEPSLTGCSDFSGDEAVQVCPSGQTCNVQTGQCELILADVPGDFSGRLWPMTGCAWQPSSDPVVCTSPGVDCCATGGCMTASGYGLDCTQSGQSPSTVAELTLLANGPDTYDVSLVDGFNVPIEIRPGPGAAAPPTGQSPAYWCGNPGGPKPLTSLPACTWSAVLDSTCNGNPALRAVDATLCSSSTQCPGSSTCNPQNVCACTQDSDCGPNQICGVGNASYIGFLTCGTFAGCAAPKDLCAVYFTGGQSCSQSAECISGNCQMPCPTGGTGCCAPSAPSAFAGLGCNQTYPGTQPSCETQADCPFVSSLPGSPWTGTSSAACVDCPPPTTCQPVPNTDSTLWRCQEPCQDKVCAGVACTSDDDCMIPFFMLCDLTESSATYQQCIPTATSLFETTGVNGVSCYAQGSTGGITAMCGGCPNGTAWPALPAGWTCASTNPDWTSAAQPWIASFKEACPTAYSFPFDDPTSTFQCSDSGTANTISYSITFCPEGSS